MNVKKLLKISSKASFFDADEINKITIAVFEYIKEKDIRNLERDLDSEDLSLLRLLKEIYESSYAVGLISDKDIDEIRSRIKKMNVNYSTKDSASNKEVRRALIKLRMCIKKFVSTPYGTIYDGAVKIQITDKDELLKEIQHSVNKVFKKYEKNKLETLIEGIIIGILSSFLFELLRSFSTLFNPRGANKGK